MQVIEVVCCKLTELQQNLYNHFLKSKATSKLVSGQKSAGVLSAITNLKKLCNHPKLIYDAMHHVDKEKGPPEGFEVWGCSLCLSCAGLQVQYMQDTALQVQYMQDTALQSHQP